DDNRQAAVDRIANELIAVDDQVDACAFTGGAEMHLFLGNRKRRRPESARESGMQRAASAAMRLLDLDRAQRIRRDDWARGEFPECFAGRQPVAKAIVAGVGIDDRARLVVGRLSRAVRTARESRPTTSRGRW